MQKQPRNSPSHLPHGETLLSRVNGLIEFRVANIPQYMVICRRSLLFLVSELFNQQRSTLSQENLKGQEEAEAEDAGIDITTVHVNQKKMAARTKP